MAGVLELALPLLAHDLLPPAKCLLLHAWLGEQLRVADEEQARVLYDQLLHGVPQTPAPLLPPLARQSPAHRQVQRLHHHHHHHHHQPEDDDEDEAQMPALKRLGQEQEDSDIPGVLTFISSPRARLRIAGFNFILLLLSHRPSFLTSLIGLGIFSRALEQLTHSNDDLRLIALTLVDTASGLVPSASSSTWQLQLGTTLPALLADSNKSVRDRAVGLMCRFLQESPTLVRMDLAALLTQAVASKNMRFQSSVLAVIGALGNSAVGQQLLEQGGAVHYLMGLLPACDRFGAAQLVESIGALTSSATDLDWQKLTRNSEPLVFLRSCFDQFGSSPHLHLALVAVDLMMLFLQTNAQHFDRAWRANLVLVLCDLSAGILATNPGSMRVRRAVGAHALKALSILVASPGFEADDLPLDQLGEFVRASLTEFNTVEPYLPQLLALLRSVVARSLDPRLHCALKEPLLRLLRNTELDHSCFETALTSLHHMLLRLLPLEAVASTQTGLVRTPTRSEPLPPFPDEPAWRSLLSSAHQVFELRASHAESEIRETVILSATRLLRSISSAWVLSLLPRPFLQTLANLSVRLIQDEASTVRIAAIELQAMLICSSDLENLFVPHHFASTTLFLPSLLHIILEDDDPFVKRKAASVILMRFLGSGTFLSEASALEALAQCLLAGLDESDWELKILLLSILARLIGFAILVPKAQLSWPVSSFNARVATGGVTTVQGSQAVLATLPTDVNALPPSELVEEAYESTDASLDQSRDNIEVQLRHGLPGPNFEPLAAVGGCALLIKGLQDYDRPVVLRSFQLSQALLNFKSTSPVSLDALEEAVALANLAQLTVEERTDIPTSEELVQILCSSLLVDDPDCY
eukprot:m.828306 g.828306  ORF g.828306 m.828306 type:complete len:868 (-) comp59437_c0_seq2:3002-5605(-)